MEAIKILFSPFKLPRIDVYFGKIAKGVPYFLPRRMVKSKDKPEYYVFKPIKWFGFTYCRLGWKTKWADTDYRHEWNPMFSFVFLGLQLHLTVVPVEDVHYWESWLYYENSTDKRKSKESRIIDCIREFPNLWTCGPENEEINYYNKILKKKYLKYVK